MTKRTSASPSRVVEQHAYQIPDGGGGRVFSKSTNVKVKEPAEQHAQFWNGQFWTDLWVDDFIACLVKEGQQLLMNRALLSITAGWAHHASHAGWRIHHLTGQPLLGLLWHPGAHVQL